MRSRVVRRGGVNVEIPVLKVGNLTQSHEAGIRTVSDGQFYWGGILLKSNGGVQSLPHRGW